MRESSFRATLQSMRRRSSVSASGGDGGFTTFTSGIRGGWQRELASPKFRQVRARRQRAHGHAPYVPTYL